MAISFDKQRVESFFGQKIASPLSNGHGVTGMIDYTGNALKYQMIISESDECVSISGDPQDPFCADSFFEFNVPCDSITECDDGYYPDQSGLAFWYGDTSQKHNMTMMILKRPDGDLKVWPSCPWPVRHPLYKLCWQNTDAEPYT